MALEDRFVVSCEHAGNRVPPPYRELFAGREALLASHRGWDIGILSLARRLASSMTVPLVATEVTRLLVDTNRSLGSRTLFSEISRPLPAAARQELLRRYYHPYRQEVEAQVVRGMAQGRVLHLSIHSFTPIFAGTERRVDVGLLYDPRRPAEAGFCARLREELGRVAADLRVRRNHPYRGTADSLVTALRRSHPGERYLGIEIEINQRFAEQGGESWAHLQDLLVEALGTLAREGRGQEGVPDCAV